MRRARLTWGYVKNTLKAAASHPSVGADCARFYPSWLRSMSPSRNPLEDGQPWLPFAAAEFLEGFLTPASRVFEYGSGASTLFFGGLAGSVHSVEHDPAWFGKVARAIARKGLSNCRHDLVPPSPAPWCGPCPFGYAGAGFPGLSFEAYVRTVEIHGEGEFDLVVVDGRSRNACIWHARSRVAPSGLLLLDNSERDAYRPGIGLLEGWTRRDFFGPYPGIGYFARATVFRKPGK